MAPFVKPPQKHFSTFFGIDLCFIPFGQILSPSPHSCYFKLNIDGSVQGNPRKASAGGLIRNCMGTWTKDFSRSIGITHSMAAKLWGLHDGLVLARNLSIRKLIIEIDAKAVVTILKSHDDEAIYVSSM